MSSAIAIVFLRTTRILSARCLGSYRFIGLSSPCKTHSARPIEALPTALTHSLPSHRRLSEGRQTCAAHRSGGGHNGVPRECAPPATFAESTTLPCNLRPSRREAPASTRYASHPIDRL